MPGLCDKANVVQYEMHDTSAFILRDSSDRLICKSILSSKMMMWVFSIDFESSLPTLRLMGWS